MVEIGSFKIFEFRKLKMKHVVLVGMMGVGKSTIGRLVAEKLQRPFIDSDVQIEQAEGKPISEIFADKGEAYFRQCELETIRRIVNESAPVVLSIGGGAFISPVVRFLLKETATTFYLQARVETLVQRVGSGATRPLLTQGANGQVPLDVRLRTLLQEREPIYTQANYIIETEELTAAQAAEAITGYRSVFA